MTIAAGYLSVDGIVFGADSTSTIFVQGLGPNPVGGEHHYNYAQKKLTMPPSHFHGLLIYALQKAGPQSHVNCNGCLKDSAGQSFKFVPHNLLTFLVSSFVFSSFVLS